MKNPTPEQIKALCRENACWPREGLHLVPRERWLPASFDQEKRIAVLRSRNWLVQVFDEEFGRRLSINRTDLDKNGDWRGGITWDELMELKTLAGYGECLAVEFYPPNRDVVNVANMRHLWIPTDPAKMPPHWRKT